jgi:UrcA family protein
MTFAAFSLPAVADDREPEQAVLSTRGVDFNSPTQVQRFYDRLNNAASAICDDNTATRDHSTKAYKTCVREAVSDAVRSINQPLLSQIDASQSRDRNQLALNNN